MSVATSRRVRIAEVMPKKQERHGDISPAPAVAKRSRHPFLRRWVTAGMLLIGALLAVVYISNAIAVNDLLASITSLEHERDVARRENEKLRAELLRLMSVERVTSLAAENLGMVQPAQPPRALTLAKPSEPPGADSAGAR